MGYECPVCGTPQADAQHLADHMGFTAVIHGEDDHGHWLDEHVPGWGGYARADLAVELADTAPEAEYPQLFEDTVNAPGEHQHDTERSGKLFEDEGHAHDHAQQHDHSHGHSPQPQQPLDDEAATVLEEAQRLTETKRANRDASMGDDESADTDEE